MSWAGWRASAGRSARKLARSYIERQMQYNAEITDLAEYGGFKACGRRTGTPFDFCGAAHVAEYFRKYFLSDFPGAGMKLRS